MTAFVKLALNGDAARTAALFNDAARTFRDEALQPQVALLESGQFQVSFGQNAAIGFVEDGQVTEAAPLKVTAPSVQDGLGRLAQQFAGLMGGGGIVTTSPTQEYDTLQRFYRLEDGKVEQKAAFINGRRFG